MSKKSKKKNRKQIKALRELHNLVIKWTDKEFDKKGPFSDYCYSQRKKNKKMDQLLTDANIENLSIASFTNYLEDNSFRSEDFEENSNDYNEKHYSKKKNKKKRKKKNLILKNRVTKKEHNPSK